jgi:hypothetical protein
MAKKYVKVIQHPERLDQNMILSIKQVPIMNDKIIAEVAALNDRSIMEVRGIIKFMGKYISNVIQEGAMETVMLPAFGRFTPNIKALQAMVKRINGIRNGKYLLELALRGKNINFTPEINPIQQKEDETI